MIVHPIPPVFDGQSEILILGSFPSTSPANAAWSIDRLVDAWSVIRTYRGWYNVS